MPSTAPARLAAEGSGGCLQQRAAKPSEGSGARRRLPESRENPKHPPMAPAPVKSRCFGGQVLPDSCAKPSANIWEGGKLSGMARREGEGCAPARWELSILLISLCQFISWQRARNESP